jgi:hypothetical protein
VTPCSVVYIIVTAMWDVMPRSVVDIRATTMWNVTPEPQPRGM